MTSFKMAAWISQNLATLGVLNLFYPDGTAMMIIFISWVHSRVIWRLHYNIIQCTLDIWRLLFFGQLTKNTRQRCAVFSWVSILTELHFVVVVLWVVSVYAGPQYIECSTISDPRSYAIITPFFRQNDFATLLLWHVSTGWVSGLVSQRVSGWLREWAVSGRTTQSVNQSVSQPVNMSVNQSINKINDWASGEVSEWVDKSMCGHRSSLCQSRLPETMRFSYNLLG